MQHNCISFFVSDVSFYSLERFVAYHMLHTAGVGSGNLTKTKVEKSGYAKYAVYPQAKETRSQVHRLP